MKRLFLLPLLFAIFIGCGSGVKTTKQVNTSQDRAESEAPQWFDPNQLEEDDIHIEPKKESEKIETLEAVKIAVVDTGHIESQLNKIVDGFRVQLMASKSSDKMRKSMETAKTIFNPLGYEVYMVYESPMYKLRVGDAITRKNVEKTLKLCHGRGYVNAWIVPDMVNSALDQGED